MGIYGISYDGLTAGLTLLHPHLALKAVSEQASPVDQWMNDDDHRYGALRESYAFEYAVMEQADKNQNTHFDFDKYDTYDWYLNAGPLTNLNDRYVHGAIPYWNDVMKHPDYDEFWRKEAWVNQLHSSAVPNLNVAGFWDQEDPWGPWRNPSATPRSTTRTTPTSWSRGPGFTEGGRRTSETASVPSPSADTRPALKFQQNIEAPFFRYYLHGQGDKPAWKVSTFQSGSNTWHTYDDWPPKQSKPPNLYLHADGTLSFSPPVDGTPEYRQYVSRSGQIRCPTVRGPSRPRTRFWSGVSGRWPISASLTTGRIC